jgi:hypothetical protein
MGLPVSIWATVYFDRWTDVATRTAFMQKAIGLYSKRLTSDLNRIASARIAGAEMNSSLTFRVEQVDATTLHVIPSDPVLFKKLEMGEFNDDGTLKTPPHSVLKELKVMIRL